MRALLIALACLVGICHAAEPLLHIAIAGQPEAELAPGVLSKLPREKVTATAHEKTAAYEGYDLRLVLAAAGAGSGEGLRGSQLGGYVTVIAHDGYIVVFSVAELDPTLGDTRVLLVDRENGQPLSPSDGPWRLVVPGEPRPARWARQVESIKVTWATPR